MISFLIKVLTDSFSLTLLVQEEDEVPDDETVNQMIARSEEEFDHFMVCLPLMYSEGSLCIEIKSILDF